MSLTRRFKNGDVEVIIPDQKKVPVDVREVSAPSLEQTPPVHIGFHPFRIVIGLEYFDPTHENAGVGQFDPPLEVHIRYTAQDLAIATNARRALRLGFWDGTRWLLFTESKHDFRLEPDQAPGTGGWGKVKVKDWNDPPKAWGT